MNRPISVSPLTWTDTQLAEAVANSTNWRSVMLSLGYGERSKSAGTVRLVRRRVAELGLETSHFRGRRRWSDEQLRQAVAECTTWEEVVTRLGLSTASGNVQPHIKGHTIRLDLDTSHLNAVSHQGRQPAEAIPFSTALLTDLRYLRTAGPVTAAAWFMLRGYVVSLPAEPAAYDLVVETQERMSRVQVKTTTYASRDGWMATVGHHPDTHSKKGYGLLAYDPDEIDLFFIVDGDMTMYLIPSRAIAGRVRILLRTYRKYIVGNASGLLGGAHELQPASA
jgi:hypothetical protein